MKSLLVIYVIFSSTWSPPQVQYIPFPDYDECVAYQKAIGDDLRNQSSNQRIKEFHTSCSQINILQQR